jgi:predicted nucleic acid-binding protein
MVRTAARLNCLDTSALVKLVVAEDRADKLEHYFGKELWYTTSFCFYEPLSVLKSKYLFKHQITEDEYRKASFDLMAEYNGSKRYVPDPDLTDVSTFTETQRLCDKHALDLSDAFQILSIMKGPPFVGDRRTVLVTDDKKLAAAAVLENCVVWHLQDDPPA